MAGSAILTSVELKEITGYQRDGDLVRHLKAQGIPCFSSKNGPWTTLELVNTAGRVKIGLAPDGANNNKEPDYL